ncbi:hypothetical protein C3Y87_12760 [Carbonactinospora thermoautotrophica]|uniref:patatin-like phospholipase family protein n=1 Tax=Carbonactinospora thermoautotrophica TaxID=1469144 RepID=UPI00226FBFFD|nr:patatin-like phospholipase family protein [Carbonactinospora thermoautotrophica]MCX9192270.1 hypothetical protein [Carbonactinospora thermoautotrophica]
MRNLNARPALSTGLARDPTEDDPGRRVGLVFSGGGAPAAYFGAGVACAVEEAGLRPCVFSGVSAGALNAGALSVGLDAAHLAELWTSIRWQDVYRPRLDVWRMPAVQNLLSRPAASLIERLLNAVGWSWFLDTKPARATLANALGGQTLRIRDGAVLIVSAVDQGTAEVVRFTNSLPPAHRRGHEFQETELTVDHLLASAAVPVLFAPGHIGGRRYVDAGLVANTPLKPALAYELDAVIVVSASGLSRPAPPPASLGDAIGLLAENIAYFALLSDYRHAETVNTLVQVAPEKTEKKQVDLLLVEPSGLAFDPSAFLRFSPRDARRLIEHGRSMGRRRLGMWPAMETLTAT